MSADLPNPQFGTARPDLLIIGAGIVGLWAARNAILSGQKVTIVEARRAGAGASGGFLGALMPHMPDQWNAKKQFQFNGLSTIGKAITSLEEDTGVDCGFRRCGRLMPIRKEQTLDIVKRRIEGADKNWRGFKMEYHSAPLPGLSDWIDPDHAPFGFTHDDLSARINPRACVDALAHFVRAKAVLIEGANVVGLEPEIGLARLADGSTMAAGKIVVAAGWESYPLLLPFMQEMVFEGRIGRGVKGQAALLSYAHADDRPILFDSGCYIVPQPRDRVAVGSTSIDAWQEGPYGEPDAVDPNGFGFHERAISLAPVLADAPIVEQWAAVRPRNTLQGRGTEPWFDQVPGHDRLIALIGGFKISFGVAHLALKETIGA